MATSLTFHLHVQDRRYAAKFSKHGLALLLCALTKPGGIPSI